MKGLTAAQVHEIKEANPMWKEFGKYFGMSQEGKTDYEIGCIQTANALLPVIEDLIIQSIKF